MPWIPGVLTNAFFVFVFSFFLPTKWSKVGSTKTKGPLRIGHQNNRSLASLYDRTGTRAEFRPFVDALIEKEAHIF